LITIRKLCVIWRRRKEKYFLKFSLVQEKEKNALYFAFFTTCIQSLSYIDICLVAFVIQKTIKDNLQFYSGLLQRLLIEFIYFLNLAKTDSET
jgi:hypothetical protein